MFDLAELGKLAGVAKDLSISAALIYVLAGAITRKWVPGIYYVESQARNAKLESLLELAHDAADRATRVSEETIRLFRDTQAMVRELQNALMERIR